ncbi:MAG: DUF4360 domain-containing protein [Oligoflexus sp.]
MFQKIFILKSFIVGVLLSLSQFSYAQTTKWTPAPPSGNGCNPNNTSVFAFGDTISWTFDDLGVNLTAGFPPGSDNKFCSIRAGAEVVQGIYLAQLTQSLTYGGIKSRFGSRGSISTNSSFFGYNVAPFQVQLPEGVDFDTALTTKNKVDNFAVIAPPSYWCNPNRNPRGLFSSRIAVNGQVTRPGASISIAAQQFDVKFEAIFGWRPCPL